MKKISQRGAARRKLLKARDDGSAAASPKGQETRERIFDAALRAFGEASFLAVTTRQIASAAAVSLPTLQYYFGDKEGLPRLRRGHCRAISSKHGGCRRERSGSFAGRLLAGNSSVPPQSAYDGARQIPGRLK